MAVRDKRSKRRSASSSRQPDPDQLAQLVFFLDHNLGRYTVVEALRARGARVEIHDDHFPPGTPDPDWLTEVGKRGWVVLSKDAAIRKRDHELAALKRAGVRAFFLTSANLTGEDMAQIFMTTLPKIIWCAISTRAPFVYTITRSGKVSLVE